MMTSRMAPPVGRTVELCPKGAHGRPRARLDRAEDAGRGTVDPLQHAWYAVRTRPRAERLVRLLLAEGGVPAWTPLEHRRVKAGRCSRRMTTRRFPLLVGYVLVGAPRDRGGAAAVLNAVLRLDPVLAVVGVDGAPAPLDRAAVERLMLIDEGRIVRLPGPGARLRLLDGPLAGVHCEGEIVELREIRGTQARVLTSLFGGLEIEVPFDRLAIP